MGDSIEVTTSEEIDIAIYCSEHTDTELSIENLSFHKGRIEVEVEACNKCLDALEKEIREEVSE